MSQVADSKAHFLARAKEYSVPQTIIDELAAADIRTLGQLAFAFTRPGQEYDEEKFQNWITTIHGGTAPSLGEAAAVRRLHFEAEIVLTASLKASIEHPVSEASTPRPIPFAERNARMEEVRRSLGGVIIEGQSEPSQALVDEVCHQYDTRVLRYLEPARCTSREHEILAGKIDKKLKLDNSTLSIRESKSIPDESISTTHQVIQCLRRRAVAYEFAGLISFTAHEKYVDRLFRHMGVEPPPQYVATTLSQVLKADREVFLYLSKNVPSIRPVPGADKPLDLALEEALKDYNTVFHLLPMLKAQPVHNPPYGPERQYYPGGQHLYNPDGGKGGKKGKSKKGSGSSMAPRGLKGCVGRDPKGRNLCFDFNLSSCANAPDGGTCPKGRHACFKAGCYKVHQFCKAHPEEMPKRSDGE